eukprot:4533013-Prorocentrum_lima.AAC.1
MAYLVGNGTMDDAASIFSRDKTKKAVLYLPEDKSTLPMTSQVSWMEVWFISRHHPKHAFIEYPPSGPDLN